MLSTRLVRMIEAHAEELTHSVVTDLKRNPKTPTYNKLPVDALHRRVNAVFQEFGEWLEHKPEQSMERWYRELGERRCVEGIHLGEVVYALTLTKYHLQEYIRSCGLADSALDLYQEMELMTLINRLFDRAIYYCVEGYMEQVSASRQAPRQRVDDLARPLA